MTESLLGTAISLNIESTEIGSVAADNRSKHEPDEDGKAEHPVCGKSGDQGCREDTHGCQQQYRKKVLA